MEVMRTDPTRKESLFFVVILVRISFFITVNLALVDFVELLHESSIAVKVVLLY